MGRRFILAVLIVMLMLGVAFADETTGGANHNSPNGKAQWLADLNNKQQYTDHTHQYDALEEREDPLGVGADVVVYEDENPDAKLEEVTVEVRHDFENEETAVFAVVRWNIFKFFKGEE
ncbi:hypothetical protein ACFL2J_05555 [Candidatus Omnitrophota bacterium]